MKSPMCSKLGFKAMAANSHDGFNPDADWPPEPVSPPKLTIEEVRDLVNCDNERWVKEGSYRSFKDRSHAD